MNSNSSPNVIFAVIIGTAIILGAVTLNSVTDRFAGFGTSVQQPTPDTLPDIQASTLREPVEHSDEDSQDAWRQTLLTRDTPRIMIPGEATDVASYTPPDTTTNRFSVSLLKPMIQSVSGEIDATTADAMYSNIIDEAIKETLPDFYQKNDLAINTDYGDEEIRAYFNSLADVFVEHNFLDKESEPINVLYEQIVDTNDPSSRSQLQDNQEVLQAKRDAILQIPVPQSQLSNHLRLLNVIHLMQHDFGNMLSYHEDTVKGYVTFMRYDTIVYHFNEILQTVGIEVAQHADLFDLADSNAPLFKLFLPDEIVDQLFIF